MFASRIYALGLAPIILCTFLYVPSKAQFDQLPIEEFFERYAPPSDAPNAEDEFDFPPFTYFDMGMENNDFINSYLLSYLSDRIYSDDSAYSDAWVNEFVSDVEELGGFNVQFMSHPGTGAEVATVETFNSLIVVFRGSSSNGTTATNNIIDWFQDFDDDARLRWIGKEQFYVHEGFWRSSDSVFDFVRPIVEDAYARGKSIWLTGHSLGGASAMLTAARLHYAYDINVHGLETFGAPRAGAASFRELMQRSNDTGGSDLASRTLRWVVDGDSAVSLFGGDWVIQTVRTRLGSRKRLAWISYHHVGRVNHVYRTHTPEGTTFEVDEDSPDLSNDMPFSVSSFNDEHLDYVRPLEWELTERLSEAGHFELLSKLLKTP